MTASATPTVHSEKLPWYTKMAFGAGDLGPAIVTAISGFFLLNFLVNVAGLDPGPAGAVILLLSFVAVYLYPITKARHAEIKAELEKKKQQAQLASG